LGGTAGIGHFLSWDGGCLLIGSALGLTPRHAHYAIQIGFGSEPGIRFRTNEHEEWTAYGGAIIPSRQPHAMDATRVSANVVIFVEPETREGRALTELYLRDGIAHLPESLLVDAASGLFAAWRARSSAQSITDAARNVIGALTGGIEPSVVSDKRILRAVAYVNSHLDTSLTLDDIAAEAFLSPSRFRHLFVEQTGMALRPYILWRRFLRVWELLMNGDSLTSAAHAAGFADAAHLTRTSRRMFGFPPSALQMLGPLPETDAGVRLPASAGLATPAHRAGVSS
jgi:AraC-like DNA-binding protein